MLAPVALGCVALVGIGLWPESGGSPRPAGFAVLAAAALWLTPSRRCCDPTSAGLGVAAFAAAWASLPALTWGVGRLLRVFAESIPPGAGVAPGHGGLAHATVLALAPLGEEVLFREHLLTHLRRRVGPVIALLGSTLLFALWHGTGVVAWAATLAGLLLGTLRLATDRLAPCIGAHAGWNAALWGYGVPAVGHPLGPLASSSAGLAGMLWLLREGRACR